MLKCSASNASNVVVETFIMSTNILSAINNTAGRKLEVSIIISTYNRCKLLPAALESILAQNSDDVSYEVIVVDNNSTDETRRVVELFAKHAKVSVRYIFEKRQGLSFGRNAGIVAASAPVIVFTDDDVCVSPDWMVNIKRAFDRHPEIGFVGGKVLPQWNSEPPSWLTNHHWSPLALQDHGDSSFHVSSERPICLVGANLAFRRGVFEQIGLFAPEFQRVKGSVGSMEDLEFESRYYRSGGCGLYEPSVIVSAPVDLKRLEKDYHRKWHTGHGQFSAKLRDEDFERASARLFDVPSHLYRQAVSNVVNWLKFSLQRRETEAFRAEMQLRFFLGFLHSRRKEFSESESSRSSIEEIISFTHSLVTKKAKDKQFAGKS